MADAKPSPVLLIRKKVSHAGHHGGAWKVAYADFVTAMMSLFIVLWLMSSTTKKQKLIIAGYFRDPHGVAGEAGRDRTGAGENVLLNKQDMNKIKTELQQSIHRVDTQNKLKNQIEMTLTPEGLRIELMEDAHGTFFETGSAQATAVLVEILKVLSPQLAALPNRISIEGHTDAQPYARPGAYSNWELSADRANTARRLMEANGVRINQVSQVRGFADQQLRDAKNPLNAANRRVSLIVQYLEVGQPIRLPVLQGVASVDGTPTHVSPAFAGSAKEPAVTKDGSPGAAVPVNPTVVKKAGA